MTRYRVTRVYVVRTHETYHVDMPDEFDPEEIDPMEFGAIDERVCNSGELVREEIVYLDNDELDLIGWEVIDVACSQCGDPVEPGDPHTGYGMCGPCLHNATRSGWEPPSE